MRLVAIAMAAFWLGTGLAAAEDAGAAADPAMVPAGDVAAGEDVFRKCATCHAIGEEATNRIGPVLNDVFGRIAGTYEGYRYSPAMLAAGEDGLVWDHEALEAYLAAPRDFIPGTKMTFAGLKDETEMADLLAYLRTVSPDYEPDAEPEDEPADE